MQSKSPLKSKTLWVNVLYLLSVVLTAVLGDATTKALLGDNIGLVVALHSGINFVVRFMTKEPIDAMAVFKKINKGGENEY